MLVPVALELIEWAEGKASELNLLLRKFEDTGRADDASNEISRLVKAFDQHGAAPSAKLQAGAAHRPRNGRALGQAAGGGCTPAA